VVLRNPVLAIRYTRNMADVTNVNPYADPAMLAYMRQVTGNEGIAQLALQNQKSKIARQIQMSTPEYQDQLAQGLRSIGNSAEASGMYQSGARLQSQNEFQVGAARQRNSYLQNAADQSNDLDLQYAQQIAQQRRQAAEQGVNSAQSVAINMANAGLF
jgi:hypothetical protein